MITEKIFKEMWFHGNEYVRKYLEKLIEYSIGKSLDEYKVQEFEDEILLISKDTVYLVKFYKKPHTIEEDTVFLNNLRKKFFNQFEELADKVSFEYVALNAFYNQYDSNIVKTESVIEINE